MSELVVQTAFTAKDTTSAILLRQANAAQTFGARLKTAFKNATKESSMFKSVLGANVLGGAITKTASLVTQFGRSTLDAFIDFDTAITMAASKFPEKIKRGTLEFDALATAAREIGRVTTFSASEAAEGFNALAGAGFSYQQAIAAMTPLVNFATAANTELGASTTIVADALGAFNLKSADAAVLTENMTRLTDSMVFVTTTQKTSLEELSEAVKMGGPAFVSAGQSMESYIAMTGLLASAGIKGGQAGTVLKGAMLKLAAPTGAAAAALKTLDVSATDGEGNLKQFSDIIAELSVATEGMATGKKTELLQKIFGLETISGAMSLMSMGGDKLKEYESQLESAAGKSSEMTAEIKQTMGNRLKDLGSTVEEFGFKIITAFEKDGKDAVGQLIDTINNMDVKPIVEAAMKLLDVFKWLFRMLRDHSGTLKVIVAMFAAWKLTMMAMGIQKFISGLRGIESAATAAAGATAGIAAPKGGAAAPGAGAGAVGAVGAVAQAAGLGYAIGTFFEEEFFNPMRLAGEKMEVELGNLASKMGRKDVDSMSQAELAKSMQKIQIAAKQSISESPITSIEGAVAHVNSGLMGMSAKVGEFFGFLSADEAAYIVEQNKGPIDVQREQLEELGRIYHEMALAVLRAKMEIDSAAKAATTEINVNVANAPAGTTVDAKGSKGAPKVNQGQAGKV